MKLKLYHCPRACSRRTMNALEQVVRQVRVPTRCTDGDPSGDQAKGREYLHGVCAQGPRARIHTSGFGQPARSTARSGGVRNARDRRQAGGYLAGTRRPKFVAP